MPWAGLYFAFLMPHNFWRHYTNAMYACKKINLKDWAGTVKPGLK